VRVRRKTESANTANPQIAERDSPQFGLVYAASSLIFPFLPCVVHYKGMSGLKVEDLTTPTLQLPRS